MKLQMTLVRQETDCIKSFELSAIDGQGLPAFTPGSHPTNRRTTS